MASAKKLSSITVTLLPLMLFVAGITHFQRRHLSSLTSSQDESTLAQIEAENEVTQSSLRLLERVPDFGFRNLMADWVFLQFLQYFGDFERRQVSGYELSADYFDVILANDPYYYPFYSYLSSSISIFAAQAERAVELQEEGLQSLSPNLPPEAYFIWRNKGIDEILFLNDLDSAVRSHRKAAEWAAKSTDPRAQEDQLSLLRTANFLEQNPDSVQIQISAWAQVLQNAPDDKTRARAMENIEALGYEVVRDEQGGYSIRAQSSESKE